jgi:NADH-quinone oxidoreductase subunit J
MNAVYYISSFVAVVATAAAVTGLNAVHSLLYLIVSFLAIALIFFTLGAPVIAALEVIIYAGAIIVLFIFVVMILNLGNESVAQEKRWTPPRAWIGPALLAAVLIAEVVYVLFQSTDHPVGGAIQPADLGAALFGPYLGRRRQPDETQQESTGVPDEGMPPQDRQEPADAGLPG